MSDEPIASEEDLKNEHAEKREPPENEKYLATLVALLLTFSAIFTMLSEWEDPSLTSANYDIVTTEFNRVQATIISESQARRDYTTYSAYLTNNTLYEGLSEDIDTLGEDNASEAMRLVRDQAFYQAYYDRSFFSGNYLKADGSYDLERSIEEKYAQLGRRTSLDSSGARSAAEETLQRKLHYMAVTFAFGIATVIFGFETLFYWERRWVRYLFIAIGIGLFIFGVINYISMGPDPLSNFNLG